MQPQQAQQAQQAGGAFLGGTGAWAGVAFVLALVLTFTRELPALQEPVVNRASSCAALLGVLLLVREHPAAAVLSACLLAQLLATAATPDKNDRVVA